MRILIVDPQPIFVHGLTQVLRENHDFEIVGTVDDPDTVMSEIRARQPDIVIIDIAIKPCAPFELVQAIVSMPVGPRTIILTNELHNDDVFEAVRLGVSGLLLKNMPPALVVRCIRKVHAGERWLEKESTGRAIESLLQRAERFQQTADTLTRREMEVLRVASSGMSNRSIADQLCISEGTVKMHLRAVYEKLGLRGRSELIIYARENRLTAEHLHSA